MHRTIIKTLAIVTIFLLFAVFDRPLAFSGSTLLRINDVEYSTDDFKHWWQHWNDKKLLSFPDSPDEFIDFNLMVQQGEAMGYENQPAYVHKLDVYRKVRCLMALQYEEVDSKVNVTDDDLRKYFDEHYGDVWTLQILAFSSQDKANSAYDYMKSYNGLDAGRLVFADLYGASDENKPLTYDEVKVSTDDFARNKRVNWLPEVKKLQPGEVSVPFLDSSSNNYILIRLIENKPAGQDVFENKRKHMTEMVVKEQRNALTASLVEKLKKKYDVKIDYALLSAVKLDGDYPKEFLDQKIISMKDAEFTVQNLIYNCAKEKELRRDLSDEKIKNFVVSTAISQTLVDKEALSRGYEKQPPLLWSYEFYKQNRLKGEVEAGLKTAINITDDDILTFYNENISSFSIPTDVTYVILLGDEATLKKLWIGQLKDVDLAEIAMKYGLVQTTEHKTLDILPKEIASELLRLDKGALSVPFPYESSYAIVKLINIVPGQIRPLAQVKSNVIDALKAQRYAEIKTQYISKLRSRSKIVIDQKNWEGLSKELRNGKES